MVVIISLNLFFQILECWRLDLCIILWSPFTCHSASNYIQPFLYRKNCQDHVSGLYSSPHASIYLFAVNAVSSIYSSECFHLSSGRIFQSIFSYVAGCRV